MRTKWYLLAVALIPWLIVPFLGKKAIRSFLPSSIFMGILLVGESLLAHKYNWWKIYKRPHPKIMGEVPLIIGPYTVGSLLMLHLGYGNILRYIILNLIVHLFFVYVLMNWFKRIGYWSLIRINKFQLFLLFTVEGMILYVVQLLINRNEVQQY